MGKRKDYEIAAENFAILAKELGLDVSAEFVPFSQSRNAGESSPSLNWRCAVTRNGKPVAGLESVDYMQGIGYAPSYKNPPKFSDGRPDKWAQSRLAACESESGKRARIGAAGAAHPLLGKEHRLSPDADDVLASLARDSDVLDYVGFDQWANEFGYDPDSRKGEAIYRLCLSQALALRAALGDDQLAKLREYAAEM